MKTILSFNKFFLTFLSLCFLITNLSSQNLTQTIRGKVIDKNTRVCLIGANVVLLDSDPLRGSTTDIDGKFKIENVPIGRVGIKVSYLGYSDVILNNLDLASAKELIFNIELEEKIYVGKEAVISGSRDKSAPINRMTTVSTRGFTVEETKRYAGSRNDVARMAANYAGVRGVSDDRNDIIIRGNSPTGLLWRLEGVDIPNPNHYGALGTTGGPVSILNNNLLDNSDFMTAAFPAEYGNALSGVFDIKMRNGNNENHEFLGQVGFNGFEIGAEGPISRKNDASYIINYRYSTLEAFDALGVDFGTGTAIPKYQDIALKINFPKTKLGSFSLFGIGGISDISMLESDKDTTKEGTNFYMGEGFDLINGSDMAVVGLTHMYLINPTTYTKFIISGSMHNFTTQIDSIVPDIFEILPWYRNNFTERKIFTSFFINKKLSSQHSIKTGVIFNTMNFSLTDSVFNDNKGKFDILTDYNGTTYLLQPYAQWKYKITDALTLNAGLHYQHLFLNNT
ncbi:MAG: carboxypeptidase-like regulatory domain-containing protein, partial [Bacteroidales bacterium]|nr:carboxypeptidase-like regulatory domain-containing protein [Bacteroidales bacterium]